jgi:tetratricopeptide (TPR) repeat protein
MLCVTRTAIAKPDVLRNYISKDPTAENYSCSIWEAASATAAAPIYFKSVRLESSGQEFSDGGLHRNNPVNETVTEIGRIREWEGRKIGCLVSIGTGSSKISSVPSNIAKFLAKAVEMLTDAERIADDFAISPTGRGLANEERYFRFNVPQGIEDLKLDDYKATGKMEALTTFYLSKAGSGRDVERCAQPLLHPDRTNTVGANVRHVPSILPRPNQLNFVERPTYTDTLRRFFHHKQTDNNVFVLWGMGGSGYVRREIRTDFPLTFETRKSQIARNFGHLMKSESMPVFWVRADKFTNFAADYQAIHALLTPSPSTQSQIPTLQALNSTLQLLERQTAPYLMILDNADDLDEFLAASEGTNSISSLIPPNGFVLLTTRDPRFLGEYSSADAGMKVEPMNSDEAAKLLFKSVPAHLTDADSIEPGADVYQLLEDLGYLPLAVAQAAANIRDQQVSILQYSRAYRDKERRVGLMKTPLRRTTNLDGQEAARSVLITWEISFETLADRDPLSAKCLNYMAFFDRQNVPHSLLMRLPGLDNLDDDEQQAVVSRLLVLSLIEQTYGHGGIKEYAIHPLVHERILARLQLEDAQQYGEIVASRIDEVFPGDHIHVLSRMQLGRARDLLPHATHIVDVTTALQLSCASVATLMRKMAKYLTEDGFFQTGYHLARRSLQQAKNSFPDGHSNILKAVLANMDALDRLERYDDLLELCDVQADPMFEHELFVSQLDRVEYDDLWLAVLVQRANALYLSKAHAESLFLLRIIVLVQSVARPQDKSTMVALKSRMAHLHQSLGELDEAEQICDELLDAIAQPGLKLSPEARSEMLRMKAICFTARWADEASAVLPTESEHLRRAVAFSRDAYNALMSVGLASFTAQSTAFDLFSMLWRLQKLDEAAAFANNILQHLLSEKPHMEGETLNNIKGFCSLMPILLHHLDYQTHPGVEQVVSLPAVAEHYEMTELRSNLEQQLLIHRMTNKGIEMQRSGQFLEAESLHRQALETAKDCGVHWIHLQYCHYQIMLAIASQSGRFEEAVQYRTEHLTFMAFPPVLNYFESIFGTAEAHLARDRSDANIHNQAKERLKASRSRSGNWWTEKSDILNRAEKRCGRLENITSSDPAHRRRDTTSPSLSRLRKLVVRGEASQTK